MCWRDCDFQLEDDFIAMLPTASRWGSAGGDKEMEGFTDDTADDDDESGGIDYKYRACKNAVVAWSSTVGPANLTKIEILT